MEQEIPDADPYRGSNFNGQGDNLIRKKKGKTIQYVALA